MAGKRLSVSLTLNDKQFQSGLRKATKSIQKFGKSMQRTGESLSRNLSAPIALAGVASIKMASDFEESLNKTRVAFGESSSARLCLRRAGIFPPRTGGDGLRSDALTLAQCRSLGCCDRLACRRSECQ